MKLNLKIILAAAVLSFLTFNSMAADTAWVKQTSGITQYTTNVYFMDQQTGWATGDQGVILKTTNGGTNWNQLTSGISSALYSIRFLDLLTGWASGAGGTLLRTTNGGTNWNLTDIGAQGNLKLFFLNSQTGWVLGNNGSITVHSTTNGGINWLQYNTGFTDLCTSIFFADPNSGWISTLGGKILRTTNGGLNWTSSNVIINETFSVQFTNTLTGYVAASGTVLKSTDGGLNWAVRSISGAGLLLSVQFINQQTGWVCGTSGKIFNTTNAGANWVLQPQQAVNKDLNCIFFNGIKGWACGQDGTMINTESGGYAPPSRPGSLTAMAVSGAQINLNWIDSSANEQNFKIERSTNGSSWLLIDSVSANVTSYQNTGLIPGTTYFYRVYASAWFGNSIYTPAVTALTFPGFPGLFSPANNSTGISLTPQLTWLSVPSAVTYNVQVSTDSLFNTIIINDSLISQLSYNVPGSILNNNVRYHWRVRAKNASGSGAYSQTWNFTTGMVGVQQINMQIPKVYKLYNNYPNPFNPSTKIKFDIPKQLFTKLAVYDLTGRVVKELVNEVLDAGYYEAEWNAASYSSGVYFYKIQTDEFTDVKKMMLIK